MDFDMNKVLHRNLISYFFLSGIILLSVFGIILYMQYSQLSNTYNYTIDSYQTIRAANQSLISIDQAALGVSSFLLTKDTESLSQIPNFITAAEANFVTLK